MYWGDSRGCDAKKGNGEGMVSVLLYAYCMVGRVDAVAEKGGKRKMKRSANELITGMVGTYPVPALYLPIRYMIPHKSEILRT